MGKKLFVIKSHGHREPYDEKKIYASVYAAALNCHYPRKKAGAIASQAMKEVDRQVKLHPAITARQIREKVTAIITDEDVRLMYRHHFDIS